MFQIKEIVNSIFSSKTYIIFKEEQEKAWLVDVGDINPIVAFMNEHHKVVAGVFLTHGHFDHIYGLLSLLEYYPDCKVYTTEYGKLSLSSDKLNLSRYHETPISYTGHNIVVVHEGDSIQLFDKEPLMWFFETPGHNPGCITMLCGNFIFTGDAYIPNLGVNTQLPYSNKTQAKLSLDKILSLSEGRIIYSGHKL